MYTIYILRCADDTLYTGIAKDVQKRINLHTKGKGSKYVRSRLPCDLVYTEPCLNRSDAQSREHEIKHMTKEEKKQLINKEHNTKIPL